VGIVKKKLNFLTQNIHKAMAVPAILLFSFFFILPLLQGVGISLTDWDGFSAPSFIGIKNFIDFFSDGRAIKSLLNTLHYGFVTPILLNIAGLFLALLLDKPLRGRNAARVLIYMPGVISALAIGYIWRIVLMREGGAINEIMSFFGLGQYFKVWLSSPDQAMWVIILVNVWQHSGGAMIIYLAGLQTIPHELYEVSCLDGAGYWQNFINIVLPLLIPAIKINVIINLIGSLAVHDSVVALTEGGPGFHTETLALYIYKMAFSTKTGYATAVALIMFVVIAIPTMLTYRFLSSKNVEM
jgi:raffinose/stachyose/melibiose transport system permease protein